MSVYPYKGCWPEVAAGCFIAPNAAVIGDVHLGEDCSVWFATTIRGDVFPIRIGARTNVQDNTVLHVTTDQFATQVGSDVTIGHGVILHGCTIGDGALIGMGTIVMDEAEVGEGALVGAGSLVTPRTKIPPGMLALGRPAKVVRPLTPEEQSYLQYSAPHYVDIAREYIGEIGPGTKA